MAKELSEPAEIAVIIVAGVVAMSVVVLTASLLAGVAAFVVAGYVTALIAVITTSNEPSPIDLPWETAEPPSKERGNSAYVMSVAGVIIALYAALLGAQAVLPLVGPVVAAIVGAGIAIAFIGVMFVLSLKVWLGRHG